MLKNYADNNIITSVYTGILACQYGMNPTDTVTTYKNCYRDAIEQSSLVWVNLLERLCTPNGI